MVLGALTRLNLPKLAQLRLRSKSPRLHLLQRVLVLCSSILIYYRVVLHSSFSFKNWFYNLSLIVLLKKFQILQIWLLTDALGLLLTKNEHILSFAHLLEPWADFSSWICSREDSSHRSFHRLRDIFISLSSWDGSHRISRRSWWAGFNLGFVLLYSCFQILYHLAGDARYIGQSDLLG